MTPLFLYERWQGRHCPETYLENVGGRLPTNFWPFSETGHTDEVKKGNAGYF